MVWYCALPLAPSFSEKAWKGVFAVPLLGGGLLPPPKAPPVLAPNPPVVVLVLAAPNPPPVLPPPNRPPPPVDDAPNPVAGLFWPKRPPPVFAVVLPKAEVVVVLLVDPNPPNPLPPVVAPPLPPPKRPPPVVELPKGFDPKAVLLVLLAPKPPGGLSQFLVRACAQDNDPRAKLNV